MSDREIITADQAKALLYDGETIHVLRNPMVNLLIGADWDREEIIKAIDAAKVLEIGGDNCVRMGHGLIIDGELFVKSRAGKGTGEE